MRTKDVSLAPDRAGARVLCRRPQLVIEWQGFLIHRASLSAAGWPGLDNQAMNGRTCLAIARASPEGTALPICFAMAVLVPTQR